MPSGSGQAFTAAGLVNTVVIGTGPRAVRAYFKSDGAQLRYGALIIDLNHDAARLVRLVVDRGPAECGPHAADELCGLGTEAICDFLCALSRDGIPLAVWGKAWKDLCKCYERPDQGTRNAVS